MKTLGKVSMVLALSFMATFTFAGVKSIPTAMSSSQTVVGRVAVAHFMTSESVTITMFKKCYKITTDDDGKVTSIVEIAC